MAEDLLSDIFHHCALWAYYEVMMETRQFPPDSDLTRKRAYALYEQENAKVDNR